MNEYGLSSDINNGRHRIVRETLLEIQEKLNHPGLCDDDRAFISSVICDPKLTVSFSEVAELKDGEISRLKQDVTNISRESQERFERIAAKDRDIENLGNQIAELKEGLRAAKLELARLRVSAEPEVSIVGDDPSDLSDH